MPLNDRPTKELALPFTKTSIVAKEWISGREQEYIEKPTTESVEVKPDSSGRVSFGKLDTNKLAESTHRAIETVVVSVNGKSENVLDAVLDLPAQDYNLVIGYIQDLLKKN